MSSPQSSLRTCPPEHCAPWLLRPVIATSPVLLRACRPPESAVAVAVAAAVAVAGAAAVAAAGAAAPAVAAAAPA
eukprot:8708796-Alexandrium_andersonii.AAC.1